MRTVRSFDPCLPCGVHMYVGDGKVDRATPFADARLPRDSGQNVKEGDMFGLKGKEGKPRAEVVANVRVGKAKTKPTAPSHTPG